MKGIDDMKVKFFRLNKEYLGNDVLFFFFSFLIGVILATTYIHLYGVNQNLDSFFQGQSAWLYTLIDISKYFFIILCLGFTPFGKAVIPIIFMIIGFGISGSISTSIHLLGLRDFLSDFIYICINTIVILPFFILFATMASELSLMIFRLVFATKSTANYNRSKIKRFIFAFFIVMISVFFLLFIANIVISSFDSFISNKLH